MARVCICANRLLGLCWSLCELRKWFLCAMYAHILFVPLCTGTNIFFKPKGMVWHRAQSHLLKLFKLQTKLMVQPFEGSQTHVLGIFVLYAAVTAALGMVNVMGNGQSLCISRPGDTRAHPDYIMPGGVPFIGTRDFLKIRDPGPPRGEVGGRECSARP